MLETAAPGDKKPGLHLIRDRFALASLAALLGCAFRVILFYFHFMHSLCPSTNHPTLYILANYGRAPSNIKMGHLILDDVFPH